MSTTASTNLPQDQNFWRKYWMAIYATPWAWAHKGENLVHAFEAVADAAVEGDLHLNMRDQALMLAGMAIEVQLKALIIAVPGHRDIVTNTTNPTTAAEKALKSVFYTHDLVAIAQQASVTLDAKQTETAEALSEFIYWRGRYVLPTDKGIDDLLAVHLVDGGIGQLHNSVTYDDTRALIDLVVTTVKSRLPHGT